MLARGRSRSPGRGGDGDVGNRGIVLDYLGTLVRSVAGNIQITGTGGNHSGTDGGSDNEGVFLLDQAVVESTGTGATVATVTIMGTAGTGNLTNNDAVVVDSSATGLAPVKGNIQITGQSNGTQSFNRGVLVTGGGKVLSHRDRRGRGDHHHQRHRRSGYHPQPRHSTVDGEHGGHLGGGAISLTGVGGNGSGAFNYGLVIFGGTVQSTGTGSGAAAITLTGTGGVGAGSKSASWWTARTRRSSPPPATSA